MHAAATSPALLPSFGIKGRNSKIEILRKTPKAVIRNAIVLTLGTQASFSLHVLQKYTLKKHIHVCRLLVHYVNFGTFTSRNLIVFWTCVLLPTNAAGVTSCCHLIYDTFCINFGYTIRNEVIKITKCDLYYCATLCYCGICYGPMSLCMSVCLSQVGVLLKRLSGLS